MWNGVGGCQIGDNRGSCYQKWTCLLCYNRIGADYQQGTTGGPGIISFRANGTWQFGEYNL